MDVFEDVNPAAMMNAIICPTGTIIRRSSCR